MSKIIFLAFVAVLLIGSCLVAWVWSFMKDWDEDDPHW